jgi:hypothetical protein
VVPTPPNLHVPGSAITPAAPATPIPNLQPSIGGCVIGETPVDSIPIMGDQATPWMRVDATLPPASELRLNTALRDGSANVYKPRTLATISEPAGAETVTVAELSPDGEVTTRTETIRHFKTVGQVVKFDGLPPASQIRSMSLQAVGANGEVLKRSPMKTTDASMQVSMSPREGPAGSQVTVKVDAAQFLNVLKMQYYRFDPSQYRLKVDYGASGGASGPQFCEIGQDGVATFQARRGATPGSFPIQFQLVPKGGAPPNGLLAAFGSAAGGCCPPSMAPVPKRR